MRLWLARLSGLEHSSIDQKAVGLVSSQGTYLGCRFPLWDASERQLIDVSHSLSVSLRLSLPSLLFKISVHILG